MISLNMAPNELNTIYRNMTDADIKMDTSIQEPNLPGSARQKLSWIFTTFQGQTTHHDFLEECMRFALIIQL